MVLPVFEEAERIEEVVREWQAALDRLELDGSIRVYDDGSRDGTAGVLDRLQPRCPRLEVVHQVNRGHGPTVLRGYREARGPWIAQADGDGEVAAGEFEKLWCRRREAPLVLGWRVGRKQSPDRRLTSAGARLLLAWTGRSRPPRDGNGPFRLWSGAVLRELIEDLPEFVVVPNLVLTARVLRRRLGFVEIPVRVARTSSGTGGLRGVELLRFAARAGRELLTLAGDPRRERD